MSSFTVFDGIEHRTTMAPEAAYGTVQYSTAKLYCKIQHYITNAMP